jgi:magnesium transporter
MNVPIGSPFTSSGATRRALEWRRFDSAAAIAVCEHDRLVGIVSLEALLSAPAEKPLSAIMDAAPPHGRPRRRPGGRGLAGGQPR